MKHMTGLRETSTDDLRALETELRETLFRLRFKRSLGDVESARKIANERKRLARIKTLLRAREIGIEK
ncbi:MAG TPA: 50S ribosomal protein L29 [Acidobacteriota bacterium]|nr:50S ribosomal protein L29 [Acidobacteriota bacterium]HMZ79837.1 50S ribosomal protein L29 [Acidobacteriota bacterium]HNB69859.1 50S ribosomal protein L29 [Acidobacteriota bacterium]HNC43291.1 50S ribosomal protein L29 [Acidobacteriota bacterium]HNG96338.1 50S ribosomal protein L29 [Acidobacteriota bacterium]